MCTRRATICCVAVDVALLGGLVASFVLWGQACTERLTVNCAYANQSNLTNAEVTVLTLFQAFGFIAFFVVAVVLGYNAYYEARPD